MEPSAISDLAQEAQEVNDALNPRLYLPSGEEIDLSRVTMNDWVSCRKDMLIVADESRSSEEQAAAQDRLFEYVRSLDPRIGQLDIDSYMSVFWDFFLVVTRKIAMARPRSPRPRSGNSSPGSSPPTAAMSGRPETLQPPSSGS